MDGGMIPFHVGEWVFIDLGWICGQVEILDVAFNKSSQTPVAYLAKVDGKPEWVDARKFESPCED